MIYKTLFYFYLSLYCIIVMALIYSFNYGDIFDVPQQFIILLLLFLINMYLSKNFIEYLKPIEEKNKLEYINRLEIIKKNIKEIQDNPILMNKLNKWIKEKNK